MDNLNLAVKEVEFNGDPLMTCKNEESEKVYVGVSWICNGIGFNKNQKDRQVKNIQEDMVLKQGCVKFDAGVFDANNETLAIELDFLPLWLAKVSITPKMKEENPFLVNKLVEYQLKAKDVLAQAFVKNNEMSNELTFLQGLLDKMKDNELKLKELEVKGMETDNKVIQLETNYNKVTPNSGFKSNDNLARSFNLYSMSDKPHFGFVDAIAKHLRIYNNTSGYKDEYVNAVQENLHGGVVGVAVYYSDSAVNLIEEFLEKEFELTKSDYKRGENKGKFKESLFVLNNKTFKFNEKTYENYIDY